MSEVRNISDSTTVAHVDHNSWSSLAADVSTDPAFSRKVAEIRSFGDEFNASFGKLDRDHDGYINIGEIEAAKRDPKFAGDKTLLAFLEKDYDKLITLSPDRNGANGISKNDMSDAVKAFDLNGTKNEAVTNTVFGAAEGTVCSAGAAAIGSGALAVAGAVSWIPPVAIVIAAAGIGFTVWESRREYKQALAGASKLRAELYPNLP